MLNRLNQPKGSTIGVLKDGRTVQEAIDALTLVVTPEMFKRPEDADYTSALRNALATGKPVAINGDIEVTGTITVPPGSYITGSGSVRQKLTVDPMFNWTADARLSPYPLFSISSPNVIIEGIAIYPVYEGISIEKGGDNVTVRNTYIGGTSDKRTKASGIVAFNVENVRLIGNVIAWCGKDSTWSTSENRILSGGCRGIDCGGIKQLTILSNSIHHVGENGIFWYGASSVQAADNLTVMCGQSGLHFAPHPDYSGVSISNHRSLLCCADGIDVRWTGSGRPRADLTIIGCTAALCGFLYGDTTKAGRDGSGVATLAYLSHFRVSSCVSFNCAGTGVYLQGAEDGSLDGLDITNEVTTASGVWMAEGCSRIRMDKLDVRVKGTGVGAGGNQTLTDITLSSSDIKSTEGASMSMPNNTHTRVRTDRNTLTGTKAINMRWDSHMDTVVYTESTGNAVYINYPNIYVSRLSVSANTSGVLVQIHASQGFSLRDASLSNSSSSSSSVTLKVTGDSSYSLISKTRVWHTGAGVALQIDDSTQQLAVEHSDIYGASGHAVYTTSAIKNLRYNNNKVSGTTSYAGGENPYNVTYTR